MDLVIGWFTTTLTETVHKTDRTLAVADTRWLVPGRTYQLPVDPADWRRCVTISRTWRPPRPSGPPVPGRVPIDYPRSITLLVPRVRHSLTSRRR